MTRPALTTTPRPPTSSDITSTAPSTTRQDPNVLIQSDAQHPRRGPGRPRTRPDALLADKAYSSRATRRRLRERRITAVIPEPRDQQANRKRRGSAGGRPVNFDKVLYKRRNLVERSFLSTKQWRGLATRYDKLAIVYRGGAVLAAIITWLRT